MASLAIEELSPHGIKDAVLVLLFNAFCDYGCWQLQVAVKEVPSASRYLCMAAAMKYSLITAALGCLVLSELARA